MINDKEKRASPPNKAKLYFKFIKHCEKKGGCETQNANLQTKWYTIQQTIKKEHSEAKGFLVHYLTLYSAGFSIIALYYALHWYILLKKSYLLLKVQTFKYLIYEI